MKKVTAILFFLPIILFSQQFEDVVYLKDGSIIRGVIIEQIPNVQIKIQSGPNIFVYKMDMIEKMAKEPLQSKTSTYSSYNSSGSSSFTKGKKSIGGLVRYSKMSYDGEDAYTSFDIEPSIGYFLTNNFSINIGLIFNSYSSESTDYSNSNKGFKLGGRFHSPLNFGLGYFGLHYHSLTNKTTTTYGNSNKNTDDAFSIGIGILQSLNDFVYLDYRMSYLKGLGSNKSGVLVFGIGVSSFIN